MTLTQAIAAYFAWLGYIGITVFLSVSLNDWTITGAACLSTLVGINLWNVADMLMGPRRG